MTTTKNNEHKKLNFSSEREQSQACLNSAEHEKNQGRKVLNVPNLRFKEFQGEWEKCKLGNIANITGGYAFKSDTLNSIGGKYQVVKMGNLYQNQLDLHRSPSYTDTLTRKAENVILRKDDIAITLTGTNNKKDFGYTYIFNDEKNLLLNQRCGLVRAKGNPYFLSCLLKTHTFLNQFFESATGGTGNQANVSTKAMEMFSVNTPSLKEQEKIGQLMALLDERIATQNKIIDKLQSLIKGIVDCTILRKEKNAIVGDVCSISEQIRAEANIDDIITVRLHGNGVCKSSAENLQLGATQYYRRRAGQLIYGKQNFHNGAIGIVPISLDNGITSKDIPSFDIDEMKCNSVYLLAQLQSPQYYKPAEALTTGTGSKRLKEETFLKMPIVLPNKREQDNIAVLIHRASMNLDHAKRLLELLSIQKQFLLRQMFI